MKKSRFTEEQIIGALRQAESGMKAAEVCRQIGVSQHTFYYWHRKYGGLGVSEAKKLRELEGENARLRKLVANLSLDNLALKEVLSKKW